MGKIKMLIFILFILNLVNGQYPTKSTPLSFKTTPTIQDKLKKNEKIKIPLIELPAVDQSEINAAIENNNSNGIGRPYRWGLPIDVEIDVKTSSKIDTLDDGMLYRLAIKSQGAKSLRISFGEYVLPPGGKLFIYNKNKDDLTGPYMKKNPNSSKFKNSRLVKGEEVIVEYFEPIIININFQSSLQIIRVTHDFIGIAGNNLGKIQDFGDSGHCQVDINCSEGNNWQNEQSGVCKILTWSGYGGSGSLINNTNIDGKPYVLTSKHIFIGKSSPDFKREVWYSDFIFNYNAPICNGGDDGLDNIVQPEIQDMMRKFYVNDDTDLLLVEMEYKVPSVPEKSYHPYYNGWTLTSKQGKGGVGIHHPRRDVKKISTHNITPDPNKSGTFDATTMDGELYRTFDYANIWIIDNWMATEHGHSIMERGSSGSPLFNTNHHIIGTLLGSTGLNCDDPRTEIAHYGKIQSSWNSGKELLYDTTIHEYYWESSSLKSWLDPLNWNTDRLFGSHYPLKSDLQIRKVSEPYSIELDMAENQIYSESIIRPEASVTYVASNEITLTPGFHAEEDSNLDIYISPIQSIPLCERINAIYNGSVTYGQPLCYNIPAEYVNSCDIFIDKKVVNFNGSIGWSRAYFANVDFANDIGDTHCAWDSVTLDPDGVYRVRVYFYGDCSYKYYTYPLQVLL